MKSIKSKLWLTFTALVILLLGIVWLFQIVLLDYFYTNEREQSVIDESKIVNQQYIESLDNNDLTGLTYSYNYLRESGKLHTFFFILDNNDSIVFPVENIKRPILNRDIYSDDLKQVISANKYEINTIVLENDVELKKAKDTDIDSGDVKNKRFIIRKAMVVNTPIYNNEDEYVGRSIFISNLIPLRETSNILKKQLSIIIVISIFIGSILALFFSKQFTKPILRITHATRSIAKGKFDTRIDVNSKDEIGILSDDVNKMARQLGMIEELRKDFISNVTHELKTPIGIIRAYAELIRDIDDEETKADNVKVIVDESVRLNEMVEDILTLSKMEAGYDKLNIENHILPSLLEDVLKRLQVLMENKSINVLLDYDEDYDEDYAIQCDYNKMFQVFYNIINNSINHSDDQSEITIRMSKEKHEKLLIEIKDQGYGIPKEELEYIWERFYKVEKSRTRSDSGTGLGMSIVKNILDLHGFDVDVESEIGVGTTVRIRV